MALPLFDEKGTPLERRGFSSRGRMRGPAAEPPIELRALTFTVAEQQESSPGVWVA